MEQTMELLHGVDHIHHKTVVCYFEDGNSEKTSNLCSNFQWHMNFEMLWDYDMRWKNKITERSSILPSGVLFALFSS